MGLFYTCIYILCQVKKNESRNANERPDVAFILICQDATLHLESDVRYRVDLFYIAGMNDKIAITGFG